MVQEFQRNWFHRRLFRTLVVGNNDAREYMVEEDLEPLLDNIKLYISSIFSAIQFRHI
jgi:hypothetical protein